MGKKKVSFRYRILVKLHIGGVLILYVSGIGNPTLFDKSFNFLIISSTFQFKKVNNSKQILKMATRAIMIMSLDNHIDIFVAAIGRYA